jgi:outer membrane immunogenic protein
MLKLMSGTAAAVAFGGAAIAADIPASVYKAPTAIAVVSSWAGPYVGASIGGRWSDAKWTTTSITFAEPGFFELVPADTSSPRHYRTSGVRAGGYAGYNWQIANWIVGLEADVAWADKTSTAVGIPGCTIGCFVGFPGPGVDTSSVRMKWDASVRGRLGFLVDPTLLVYGTGGVAFQNVRASGTCQHSLGDPVCTVASGAPFETRATSKTLVGWTAGGGLEKMFGNWLLRGEYRYASFEKLNRVLDFRTPAAEFDTHHFNLSVHTHTALVGLAYKFGGPVIARY